MTQAQLKKLRAKWYKKLAKTGFKDIENPLSVYEELGNCEGTYFQRNWSPAQFVEKQRYFELATQLLHDPVFKSEKDRKAWEMHTNGATQKQIMKKLKVSADWVYERIKYYASFIKRT